MESQSDSPAGQRQNPYAAPEQTPLPLPIQHAEAIRGSLVAAGLWSVLFWLNTPLCFMLSWEAATDRARLGISAGCFAPLVPGVRLVYRVRSARAPLVIGAVLVGLGQFGVVLHLYVGLFGFSVCRLLTLVQPASRPQSYETVIAGLVMTLLTGGTLLMISAGAGWATVMLWHVLKPRDRSAAA